MATLIGLRSGGVLTIDGKTVDASAVELTDIAYGLGSLQRFGGQLDRWYSVAEHSVILSEIHPDPVDYGQRIAALFHDAAETLGAGDVNAFLKTKEAKKVEQGILDAVLARFSVAKYGTPALDRWLGNWEATHIIPAKHHWESPAAEGIAPRFRHWDPRQAADAWLTAYHNYTRAAKFLLDNDVGRLVESLRPGVPFDAADVCARYPLVDPVAVVSELSKVATLTTGGKYVR